MQIKLSILEFLKQSAMIHEAFNQFVLQAKKWWLKAKKQSVISFKIFFSIIQEFLKHSAVKTKVSVALDQLF